MIIQIVEGGFLMRSQYEIESTMQDINNKIQQYTKDLSKAMKKGQYSKQNEYMSEISELQRQLRLLNWILN